MRKGTQHTFQMILYNFPGFMEHTEFITGISPDVDLNPAEQLRYVQKWEVQT